ncbi:MAG: MFS transporter [Verrucomicrobia bacterium]|nr:MFS transporter [Verrucomicrobiota bacterium]
MNATGAVNRPVPSAPPAAGAWQRGFWSLIVTQFQGAFSDNLLRYLVSYLVLGMGLSRASRDALVPIIGALFALPFILFSMAGGYLADRYSKRTVCIGVKFLELFIMLFTLVGLTLNHLELELASIFLMGVHSAIFGPSKYGLLPEILAEHRLSWGNGILELGTFLAITIGPTVGGLFSDLFRGRQYWSGLILMGLALVGLATSQGITRVPPADPAKRFQPNFTVELLRQLRSIRRDRVLWLALVGNTYFFLLGALVQFNILLYGKDVLHLSDTHSSYLQAAVAIGIGTGSLAAGYLSGGKIEYGLVPLGALGMTGFGAALGLPGLTVSAFAVYLALLGFFGGFFIVPLSALLQHRPEKANKGSVLAAANLLSFVGVFLASGLLYLMATVARLTPSQVFLASAIFTLAGTAYTLWLLPDAVLRLVLWGLTHSIYRIRTSGREHIPAKGGALFVANHLSLIDALLLQVSTDRPIRFIMYKGMYERPWIKPFARILRVIPISSQFRPREMIAALRTAHDAILNGEVVCVFAEGQITRIGQMLPFRRGFERIMKEVQAPIIPVGLDGVWGSIFSFEQGRFYWKLPRRIPYLVAIHFGAPMPPTSTPVAVREVVQGLLTDAWPQRQGRMLPLHRGFVQTARLFPLRFAMADATTPGLRFGAALTRTVWLALRLQPVWRDQSMVGILLPPSVPAALVNFAALLSGKIPVNLNYTVSAETLAACVRQCEIRTVVTSRAFLQRLAIQPPCPAVPLEDLVRNRGLAGTLRALLIAWTLPVAWLERVLRGPRASNASERDIEARRLLSRPAGTSASAGSGGEDRGVEAPFDAKLEARRKTTALDAVATVIFSSGSTGDPKGVVLSHYNIASNLEQLGQTFGLRPRDRFLGVLPFFHSFGFTATLCLPGVLGVGVVYHANPLDAKTIGQLVRRHAITFLLATPTFLRLYLRGCEPEDFGSLQFVMAGAEKLPERVAAAFEEQFGIRPLEGYGCTECSPAVAVNTRDFRAAGFRQVGTKRGSIGHPLPGVSVRIVDPETWQPRPLEQPGLLLVRGPNVMQGYLGRPTQTAEVMRDGWYVTGDIAALDADGFLHITDRLSRFSKIGGEMVPHLKVEEELHELVGATAPTFAVTGVPDERKGERLVVLHTLDAGPLQACLDRLAQAGLPNLWVPRPGDFHRVEALPYLGTGKLDLRKIRELALRASAVAKAGA